LTPDRARRIEQLFAQALEHRPDERPAFLAKECGGDEALRREVESLIAEESRADSFMEKPAVDAVSHGFAASGSSWAGRRLGHYELGQMLGAGGMGHVYKATDTRLGRTVAIKILADHFLNDSRAKLRFEREAKTIAALNHPHICVLHDIGKDDGVDFLVMEYLKGITLAQKLSKGPLPQPEVVKIAVQIADALDKAHREGVTHRDLKPANVMLTENGAKLLDFGVAKSREARATASDSTVDADALTGAGVIVGTPQYMAPEQIEGKQADARSDVFAFGSVWFEMLTGKKAFVGQTAAALMSAILHEDPPALPADFPPPLVHALGQCWAKNPDERWQSMADLKREIIWMAELPPREPQPRGVSRREVLAWGAAGVLGTAAGALWTRQEKSPTIDQTRARFSIPEPAGLQMNFFQMRPSISPDGRMVAFFASDGNRGSIWLRRLDSGETRALAETEGAVSAFWSPDSRSLAFYADDKLKRLSVDGSPAQTICDAPSIGSSGCWSESGIIIFQSGFNGVLHQVPATGGASTPIVRLDSPSSSQFGPTVLPDGKTVLYTQFSSDPEQSGVYAVTLGSSKARRILPIAGVVRYVAPGYLLLARDATLTAQPFNPSTLQPHGEAWTLSNDVWTFQGMAFFEVSSSGIVVYNRVGAHQSQLAWFDRLGRRQKNVGPAGPFIHMDLSRDEKRVVLERYENGRGDLWLLDLAREAPTRLTFGPAWALQAHWAPDNAQIVYASADASSLRFVRRDAGGSREEDLLKDLPMGPTQPTHWSDDGHYVIFTRSLTSGKSEIWLLPVEGQKPAAYTPTPSPVGAGCLSPDGKWMAYLSTESGAMEVYVAPFPNPTAKWRISTTGGTQPRWRADGKELFYLAPDKTLMSVAMPSPDRAAIPVALFKTGAVSYFYASRNDYTPSRDGQSFLVNTQTSPGAQFIDVIIGWQK
jgi:eukaryotic-like serine/threonine-protein kinase